jgi:GNAT superfamily N-acetyltransferase
VLLAVYASTRALELSALGWPGPEAKAFARMQFGAQLRHYGSVYPNADHYVVSVGGAPAGRLIVDRSVREVLIIDIALLPQFRRAGVGRELIERVIDEAATNHLPVRCHVVSGNQDALRFWQRLGFVAGGRDGAHISLERACETSLL